MTENVFYHIFFSCVRKKGSDKIISEDGRRYAKLRGFLRICQLKILIFKQHYKVILHCLRVYFPCNIFDWVILCMMEKICLSRSYRQYKIAEKNISSSPCSNIFLNTIINESNSISTRERIANEEI